MNELVIKSQRYEVDGFAPLTFAVFLDTDLEIEGLEHWQSCEGVFVCYSRTMEGAQWAVKELERFLWTMKT